MNPIWNAGQKLKFVKPGGSRRAENCSVGEVVRLVNDAYFQRGWEDSKWYDIVTIQYADGDFDRLCPGRFILYTPEDPHAETDF
jgi:hypothetical protein